MLSVKYTYAISLTGAGYRQIFNKETNRHASVQGIFPDEDPEDPSNVFTFTAAQPVPDTPRISTSPPLQPIASDFPESLLHPVPVRNRHRSKSHDEYGKRQVSSIVMFRYLLRADSLRSRIMLLICNHSHFLPTLHLEMCCQYFLGIILELIESFILILTSVLQS